MMPNPPANWAEKSKLSFRREMICSSETNSERN
jgi:hypothetical protein